MRNMKEVAVISVPSQVRALENCAKWPQHVALVGVHCLAKNTKDQTSSVSTGFLRLARTFMNDKPKPQDCGAECHHPVLCCFCLGLPSTLSSLFSLSPSPSPSLLLLLFDFKFHSLRVYQWRLTKTSAILRKLRMEQPQVKMLQFHGSPSEAHPKQNGGRCGAAGLIPAPGS